MPVDPRDIFVNCPFDDRFKPMFNAIVFTVVRSGYRARCALETDDAGETRLARIFNIIAACKFGIHDISRTDADEGSGLPRFNMPLELGIFLGAKRYGSRDQKGKICIIFDREQYRYQQFISDIAGQDIHSHEGDVRCVIRELTTWLRGQPGGSRVGGGHAIVEEYEEFERFLPRLCEGQRLRVEELGFPDFNEIVTGYVATLIVNP